MVGRKTRERRIRIWDNVDQKPMKTCPIHFRLILILHLTNAKVQYTVYIVYSK